MSVKIARLKNGEDIICDIMEVYTKEDNKLAGVQLTDPYSASIIDENMFVESSDPNKKSNPKLALYPWTPLSSDNKVYIDPTELLCVYEPHEHVLKQYEKLLEVKNGGGTDDGGRSASESTTSSDQNSFVEAKGIVPDWEGN